MLQVNISIPQLESGLSTKRLLILFMDKTIVICEGPGGQGARGPGGQGPGGQGARGPGGQGALPPRRDGLLMIPKKCMINS